MPNYVKFLRGTHAAYNALSNKDDDTLYFVYEEDKASAELYLGDKLIAGGSVAGGASALEELSDISLDNVQDKDLLVYDGTAEKWVNKTLDNAISTMVGSTSGSSGQAGLVPAPEAYSDFRYLRSDGTWAEIKYEPQIFVAENSEKANHVELIQSIVVNSTILKGDMFIVKDPIADRFQHTAYVYDGAKWVAMDGNYNAENVYFDEDFIFTEAIGTVEIPEAGNVTVAANGKNLKEFFASIFAKEAAPEVVDPTVSISLAATGTSFEVGTVYNPGYAVSFTPGSYEYGPDTGITATFAVEDSNGNTSVDAAGTFASFTIGTDTEYSISVSAEHTEGAIPMSNLGNPAPDSKIAANTLTASIAAPVKGYRKSFYGTLTEKNALDSDAIRGLAKSSTSAMRNGSSFSINVPVGALRVVIAYPDTLRDLSSVLDKNDSNANIVSGFGEPEIIAVYGANSYDAINYKVYKMDFANPYDAANVFTVTI